MYPVYFSKAFFLPSFFLYFEVVKIRWDNFIFSYNFIYKELIMGSWICNPSALQVHANNRIHDDNFPPSFELCKTNCSNSCFETWGRRKMIIKRISNHSTAHVHSYFESALQANEKRWVISSAKQTLNEEKNKQRVEDRGIDFLNIRILCCPVWFLWSEKGCRLFWPFFCRMTHYDSI